MKKNILIIFLIILNLSLLSGFIIYTKANKDSLEPNDNIVTENKSDNNQFSQVFDLLIGTYEYNTENLTTYNCPINSGEETVYMKLVLNEDGTASGINGEKCASGYSFEGKYYISKNQIVIDNEKCQVTNINAECIYPNCTKKVIFSYRIIDGVVNIEYANQKITRK